MKKKPVSQSPLAPRHSVVTLRHAAFSEIFLFVSLTNAMNNLGLATQLALAYAIHKTFFFVRVPLTVAVTPRIVKQLRAWGWNIGKKIVRRR